MKKVCGELMLLFVGFEVNIEGRCDFKLKKGKQTTTTTKKKKNTKKSHNEHPLFLD